MRKLTIKRKWSIIECASKITLIVENHKDDESDVEYQEFPFKNGKSITLDISNQETKICVESSTMQALFSIPAGDNDVTLVAKPKYNPLQGNPFTIEEIK